MKRPVLSLAGLATIFIVVSAVSSAAAPVPQDIGLPDASFRDAQRSTCEVCHSGSISDRHHSTQPATEGRCVTCHEVTNQDGRMGVGLPESCSQCHEQSPHHRTEAATNRQCLACHQSAAGVSEFGEGIPEYAASRVTPTRDRCHSCHQAGTAEGLEVQAPKETHHDVAMIGCDACHLENRADTNIRLCERCHNPVALHSIPAHVAEDACVNCHGGGE